MRNVFELTDQELEDCFDGSSSVTMVREILQKDDSVYEGYVVVEAFAQWFAYGIKGYIDADEGSDAWQEAWNNNYIWGKSIAQNINDYLDTA